MRLGIKKYAIEFAVIFLSITISFIVEEWRTNQQETKLTKEFLLRLKAELTEKTLQTQLYLNYNRASIKSLERISVNFKTREISDDSLFQYLIESQSGGMFNPELATWESLKSSGILANVKPEVIDSVNSLLQKYKAIEASNKYLQDMFILTWPMFVHDIPPTEVTDQWIMFFQKGDMLLSVKQFNERADLSKFLASSVAIDYYFTKLLITYGTVEYYKSLPEKEKRLIELIEKEIEE